MTQILHKIYKISRHNKIFVNINMGSNVLSKQKQSTMPQTHNAITQTNTTPKQAQTDTQMTQTKSFNKAVALSCGKPFQWLFYLFYLPKQLGFYSFLIFCHYCFLVILITYHFLVKC